MRCHEAKLPTGRREQLDTFELRPAINEFEAGTLS